VNDAALNESEEKALIGVLYNHVSFGTTLQVFGEADAGNARIDTLRGALEKLLVKYELMDKLSPDNLLMLGITNGTSKDALERFANDENNKHLQLRAQYYLKNISS